MNRRLANSRLAAVHETISSRPFRLAAVDAAYATLLENGHLPDDARLAWTVLRRALHARKRPMPSSSSIYQVRAFLDCPPPRDQVFREAVAEFDPARDFARLLIGLLTRAGCDPSDPEFIPSDAELPEFGSAAAHFLGWPDQWVKPPYEQQLRRVLRQHAALRDASDGSDALHRDAAAGLAAFLTSGELPTDPLLRQVVLTIGEMFAIHADYFGRGDADLLATYEQVATTTGEVRDVAVATLGELQVRATEAFR